MSLPPNIDNKVRIRFEELVAKGETLIKDMRIANTQQRERANRSGVIVMGAFPLLNTQFHEWKTKILSLLNFLEGGNSNVNSAIEFILPKDSLISETENILGILKGVQSDYLGGFLGSLTQMIEAEVISDYLGQAQYLLTEGQPGSFDHVPAAVLTGAILEDALRRLCLRQTPLIDILKPSGEPKTMGLLIDDLKKGGVYNELKAKQLRSWADIRNSAAHGKFTEFTRQDVEIMLDGVRNFLADYL